MTRSGWLACSLVLLLAPLPAAGAERLSDAASPQQRVVAETRWREDALLDGRRLDEKALHAMVASIPSLEVRLDTSAFVGSRARIFLGLPLSIRGLRSPGGMRMSWQSRGRFQDGSVVPGHRSILFEGEITEPSISDFLDVTLELDARDMTRGLTFDPIYEIEVQ